MPWSASDADKHKKGLTPAQKKKWAKVANSVLKECLDDGGSQKTCEAKAIRIANSKFAKLSKTGGDSMEVKRIPKQALQLVAPEEAEVKFRKDGEDGPRLATMLGYSGKVIKGHWYWGDLVIDTAGVQFSKKKLPILEDHMTSRKVGFSMNPHITDKHQVVFEDITVLDNDFGNEFYNNSKQGFPYEASVYARPQIVEELGDGESADVNGFKFKGPGTIFRKTLIKEGSVCVFGWDSQTKSQALSEGDEVEIEYESLSKGSPSEETTFSMEEEFMPFDIKKFREENPEGYKELTASISSTIREEVKGEYETKLAEVQKEKEGLETKVTELSSDMTELQKRDVIRTEKELMSEARSIVNEQLAESSLPNRVQDKVRNYVDHEKFVKESVLDRTAFAEHVQKEVESWEKALEVEATEVRGGGNTGRTVGESGEFVDSETRLTEDDVSATVNRMLGYVTKEAPAGNNE